MTLTDAQHAELLRQLTASYAQQMRWERGDWRITAKDRARLINEQIGTRFGIAHLWQILGGSYYDLRKIECQAENAAYRELELTARDAA